MEQRCRDAVARLEAEAWHQKKAWPRLDMIRWHQKRCVAKGSRMFLAVVPELIFWITCPESRVQQLLRSWWKHVLARPIWTKAARCFVVFRRCWYSTIMLKNKGESREIHCFASKKPIVSIDTQAAYRTQILKSETTLKTWHFVSFSRKPLVSESMALGLTKFVSNFLTTEGKVPMPMVIRPSKKRRSIFLGSIENDMKFLSQRMCKIDNAWQYHRSITNLLVKYLPDWLDLIEGSRRQIGWTSLVTILRRDLIWQNEVLNISIILDIQVIIIRHYIISKFLCAP